MVERGALSPEGPSRGSRGHPSGEPLLARLSGHTCTKHPSSHVPWLQYLSALVCPTITALVPQLSLSYYFGFFACILNEEVKECQEKFLLGFSFVSFRI